MPTQYGIIIKDGINYSHDTASSISFVSGGGLLSNNVQDVIEEINNKIPAAQVNSDWNATSGVAQILNKPSLATVAISGNYNDLSNKPSIPTVPTNISAFTNDSGYITSSGSCNYANSAGSAGTATTAGSADGSPALTPASTTGYSSNSIKWWWQGNGWQGSPEDWGTFLVANTGNGTWYSQALLLPWHNNNIMYGRMQGGVFQGWATIVTNDNITSFEHNDHAIQTDAGENWNINLFGSFAGTSDTTQRSEGFYKSARFIWNPYWCELYLRTVGCGMIGSAARQQMLFAASNETTYRLFLGVADNMWTLSPSYDGQLQLGTTGRRWGQIFSTNAAINTSDRKEKKDIEELDEFARTLIMSLKPCSYKFINGKSGRTHYGMIAQDIEESLDKLGITAMDLAAFCKDSKYTEEVVDKDTENEHVECTPIEGEYTYGLRYEEFIAPMIKTIQLQQKELDEKEERIKNLEERLSKLEALLSK